MKSTNPRIKVKIEHNIVTDFDPEEVNRWENEGGSPSESPLPISHPDLPLHKKEIFEVLDCEIIVEDGQLYLEAEIDILSHH
ncbi:hypothetical protein LQ318_00625 [Aliifodinibius salicampi]|uniref:Uncharacterized protein n=1 Tax=Fodinibius salicampi TaxID=1920655 RepID=A0ABT3PU71_9BACT|nr:hypothetical protein [Fodinibius salicampi]MCW9711394.1 hypothetical protein [Fodinibius salicampi]